MSNEQWDADIPITPDIIKDCLKEQFPSLALKTITTIGEGWDNKAFLVNNDIIFRFPRRKIAVELIERENHLLKHLRSMLDIEIPNPQYIGHSSAAYPYPFQGYKKIKGLSGCHAQLSVQQRFESLSILAAFLKQLHDIDEAQALAIGAKAQLFDRTNINNTITILNERVAKIIAQKLYTIDNNQFQQEVLIAQKTALSYDTKCLVHGDLYCKHLMFNKGQLTGIIDWGDVGISHRAVDLAVIWSFYPSSCHPLFFEIYGTIDPTTWQYARFLGLYSALTLLFYGNAIGDTPLVTEAIKAVNRINPHLLVEAPLTQ